MKAKETVMKGTMELSRARNWTLACLGLVCVALGIVGIFVPGLPTTVFLLLASWLFAHSCPALQRRLHAHPQLGAYLQMARERRMPKRAKAVSVAAIWGGITLALVTGASDSSMLGAVLVVSGVLGTAAVLLLGLRRTRTGRAASSVHRRKQGPVAGLTRVRAGF